MSVMKVLGTGIFACSISLSSASSADLYGTGYGSYKDAPYPLPYAKWQGFYIGGYAGWGWSDLDITRSVYYGSAAALSANSNGVAFGGGASDNGVLGGIQLGYNFQTNALVYGFEADLGGIDLKNEHSYALTPADFGLNPATGAGVVRVKTSGGFYGDLTARAGYDFNNFLFYAKGGIAWLDATNSVSEIVTNSSGVTTFSGTRSESHSLVGWTAGLGAEYLINPNWSIKAEYAYFDLYNDRSTCCSDPAGNSFKQPGNELTINVAKVGFNYHLPANLAPLK